MPSSQRWDLGNRRLPISSGASAWKGVGVLTYVLCLSSHRAAPGSVHVFFSSSYFPVTHLHAPLPYHSFYHLPSDRASHSGNPCCSLPPPRVSSAETRVRLTVWHLFHMRPLWSGAGTSLASHPLIGCLPTCTRLWLLVG